MSANAPTRETARRVFAQELNNATHTFRESDEERAPVYALLPTGASANRVFIAGTLTETEDVGNDDEYWRGRIVDPTGTFYTYAGQYQPEAATMLRKTDTPAFVSAVGKPRTYETEDGEVNVSIRPESITIVSEGVRDRWIVETAERTLERITAFTEPTNEHANMADEEYETDLGEYQQMVIDALVESDETASAPEESDSSAEANAEACTQFVGANRLKSALFGARFRQQVSEHSRLTERAGLSRCQR